MTSFIKFCFAFILLSFAVTPIYFGVNKKHKELIQPQSNKIEVSSLEEPISLSFAEIYAIADENSRSPENLNNINTAAGEDLKLETFSSGFNQLSDQTL